MEAQRAVRRNTHRRNGGSRVLVHSSVLTRNKSQVADLFSGCASVGPDNSIGRECQSRQKCDGNHTPS